MKRLRHGPQGAEKPGLINASGALRDLSGVVPDTVPVTLGRDFMPWLEALDRRLCRCCRPAPVWGPV